MAIESTMLFTLIIFVITYLLIVLFYQKKTIIIWIGIIFLLLLGILSPLEGFLAINWNILGIYVGMLFVSEMLIYSKSPEVLAEKIVTKSPRLWIAMLGICFMAGFISIVVENVAVVLIIAPVALAIANKLKIHPGPLIVGIAISSNLQGVATMVGDPPSLLLANYAGLSFNDFFFFQGKPALFFAVQIAAIASLVVLYVLFKHQKMKLGTHNQEKIRSKVPIYIFAIMLFLLISISMFEYSGGNAILKLLKENDIGIICLVAGLVSALWYYKREKKDFLPMASKLDWDTAGFLIGIFVIVQALVNVGFMELFAGWIASITGSNVFLAYNLIIWSSVLLSGFIDNVPFIAAMLPVVGATAEFMGVSPYLFYFGLVIGASVGGNITPIGASANVVAMGLLKKNKHAYTFWEFVKIGLPFTLVSVIASTTFIWFLFK